MKDHRKERAEARKKAEKPSGNAAARNYTYILKCGDGSLYTGWTNDIAARLEPVSYTHLTLPTIA